MSTITSDLHLFFKSNNARNYTPLDGFTWSLTMNASKSIRMERTSGYDENSSTEEMLIYNDNNTFSYTFNAPFYPSTDELVNIYQKQNDKYVMLTYAELESILNVSTKRTGGGRKSVSPKKSYVCLKGETRKRKVYKNEAGTFIRINNGVMYLKDIRNRYKYVS